MKRMMSGGLVALLLVSTGCTQTDRSTATGAAIGGLGGAAIGAAVSDNDLEGALVGGAIGAAAGAVAGNVIGRSQTGDCIYRDSRTGQRYVAECP